MRIENRLAGIEKELGIGRDIDPMVLIIGKRGRKVDEAELERRIEEESRRRPTDPFILLHA